MILDTHVLLWFVDGNDKLDKNIREDIENYRNTYAVSIASIMEIINLVQLGKYNLGISIKEFIHKLVDFNIRSFFIFQTELEVLEKLPMIKIDGKIHSDLMDRMIIAQAISSKNTLISADRKFPAYRKYGLNLIQVNA